MNSSRPYLSLSLGLLLAIPSFAQQIRLDEGRPLKKSLYEKIEMKQTGLQFEAPLLKSGVPTPSPDLYLILDLQNIEKMTLPEGPRTGGGGNSCALAVKTATEQIKMYLNHGKIQDIVAAKQIEELSLIMSSTRIYTKSGLTLNGETKDAINFPEKRAIVFDSKFCQNNLSSLTAQNLSLIFHEYLGLARIPDQQYQISKVLFEIFSTESTIQQKAFNDLVKYAQKDLAGKKSCFQGEVRAFLKEAREKHARGPIPELNYRISLISQSTINGNDPYRYATFFDKSGKEVNSGDIEKSGTYLTNQYYTESDFLFVPFVYNFPTGGQDEIPLLIRVTRKEIKSFKMDLKTEMLSDINYDVQYICKKLK